MATASVEYEDMQGLVRFGHGVDSAQQLHREAHSASAGVGPALDARAPGGAFVGRFHCEHERPLWLRRPGG